MMRIFCILIFLLYGSHVEASQVVFVEPVSSDDLIRIEQLEISKNFYGELSGFPHTFEFTVNDPSQLDVQILEPDTNSANKDHSGIVVRNRDNGRGVEAIVRLNADESTWDSFYDVIGGDRYLKGPGSTKQINPGTYLIEVSGPKSEGKYVLSVGKIEDPSNSGYFQKISEIYKVKNFLGKSPISMLGTPFIYIPFISLALLVYMGRRIYKNHYA